VRGIINKNIIQIIGLTLVAFLGLMGHTSMCGAYINVIIQNREITWTIIERTKIKPMNPTIT